MNDICGIQLYVMSISILSPQQYDEYTTTLMQAPNTKEKRVSGLLCNSSSSRKVLELAPTAVFALATPKSPIDRGMCYDLDYASP
jgi:hypothetical protein